MSEILILDTGSALSIYEAGGSEAPNRLTHNGRRVYVPSVIQHERLAQTQAEPVQEAAILSSGM